MVRIGSIYINPDCVECIMPNSHGRGYVIVTSSGRMVDVDVSKEDLDAFSALHLPSKTGCTGHCVLK